MHLNRHFINELCEEFMQEYDLVPEDFNPESAEEATSFVFSFEQPFEKMIATYVMFEQLLSKNTSA